MEYKGYTARIHYTEEDKVLHGRIEGIKDLITFEAISEEGIRQAFEESVDDYIKTCLILGLELFTEQKVRSWSSLARQKESLRNFLIRNKERVIKDLEEMRNQSKEIDPEMQKALDSFSKTTGSKTPNKNTL